MLTPISKSQRYLRVGDVGHLPYRLDRPAGPTNSIRRDPWIVVAFLPEDRILVRSLYDGAQFTVRAAWAEEYLEEVGRPPYVLPKVDRETGRRKLWEAKHPADGRPGNYYVSAVYGTAMALLLGPFKSHRESLDKVPLGRALCDKHIPTDAPWFAYGTVRMADDFTQPGKLNQFA